MLDFELLLPISARQGLRGTNTFLKFFGEAVEVHNYSLERVWRGERLALTINWSRVHGISHTHWSNLKERCRKSLNSWSEPLLS